MLKKKLIPAMSQKSKAKFLAIGVGQGDAFFIERADKLALVDGGKSRGGFAFQFKNITGLEHVDILVCTHNDSDHALGLVGFFECGFTATEVWLPASWTDRLEDLLLQPDEFFDELIGNIEESEAQEMNLEDLGNSYSATLLHRERYQEQLIEIDVKNISLIFEAASERTDDGDLPYPYRLNNHYWYRLLGLLWVDRRKLGLFNEALLAATLIRELSLAAFHSGAAIRWFDYIGEYQRSSKGGAQDFLIPINAEEVVKIRRSKRTALEYLALTKANKESLVFMSPSEKGIPPILFTADSDLNFSQPIGWSNRMLITAPHHGSESNAGAYSRFRRDTNNAINDVVWVRSDGRFSRRPGNSYLQSSGRRYCTICRPFRTVKQNVRLVTRSNIWKPISTRICHCV